MKKANKEILKTIEVENCHECSFCNIDNEFGYDHCNLDNDIYCGNIYTELPEDKVHDKCPLKTNNYRIKLK